MDRFTSITDSSKNEFTVHEVWFEPDTGGFFRKPATVYLILTPKENEKESLPAETMEIPFSMLKVHYNDKAMKPELAIEVQTQQTNSPSVSGIKTRVLVSAVITALPGFQILKPREKQEPSK